MATVASISDNWSAGDFLRMEDLVQATAPHDPAGASRHCGPHPGQPFRRRQHRLAPFHCRLELGVLRRAHRWTWPGPAAWPGRARSGPRHDGCSCSSRHRMQTWKESRRSFSAVSFSRAALQFGIQLAGDGLAGQLVLGLHLQRIGRLEHFDIGGAADVLAAVGADIVGGDDKALAALDMGLDALAQQRRSKRAAATDRRRRWTPPC